MAETVLTGVDGTETARLAAHKAAELATAFGAKLHVISAYTVDETGMVHLRRPANAADVAATFEAQDHAATRSQESAGGTAKSVANELRERFPDLEITSTAVEGEPAEAMVEQARLVNADIVVVGNRRVQGLRRVLGSIAGDIAKNISCDLYVAYTNER